MSKDKNNTEENQETNEPLLSVVTTKPIAPAPKEESAFQSVLSKPVEQPAPTQPTVKPPVPKEVEVVQPQKQLKSSVCEIVYINDTGEEVTLYTNREPVFESYTVQDEKHEYILLSLKVKNIFGKQQMHENVLGISEVRSSCRRDFDVEEISIPLNKGVVIKNIVEESWMFLDYEETKRIFDEAVLKAYRQASTNQTVTQPQQRVKKNNIPPQGNGEIYQEGNLPFRPPIMGEL